MEHLFLEMELESKLERDCDEREWDFDVRERDFDV